MGANPFIEEKFAPKEWHDRLGDGFWKELHRSAVFMEELDSFLSDPHASPCKGYESQSRTIPEGLALISVLDHDDYLYLPRELSLSAIHRGVTVEQFVGQWRGNLLDPGKGRLPPGSLGAAAFQIVPQVGKAHERLEHGVGVAMAMRMRGHSKIVILPILIRELKTSAVQKVLQLVAKNNVPVAFLVVDGDAAEIATACGIRSADCTSADILGSLKLLKNQMDRIRSRKEPALIYFSRRQEEVRKLSEVIQEIFDRKGWSAEAGLKEQVRAEIAYGIDRARMIPLPPKNTVVQDVRQKLEPHLEADWAEWRKVHGK